MPVRADEKVEAGACSHLAGSLVSATRVGVQTALRPWHAAMLQRGPADRGEKRRGGRLGASHPFCESSLFGQKGKAPASGTAQATRVQFPLLSQINPHCFCHSDRFRRDLRDLFLRSSHML